MTTYEKLQIGNARAHVQAAVESLSLVLLSQDSSARSLYPPTGQVIDGVRQPDGSALPDSPLPSITPASDSTIPGDSYVATRCVECGAGFASVIRYQRVDAYCGGCR